MKWIELIRNIFMTRKNDGIVEYLFWNDHEENHLNFSISNKAGKQMKITMKQKNIRSEQTTTNVTLRSLS